MNTIITNLVLFAALLIVGYANPGTPGHQEMTSCQNQLGVGNNRLDRWTNFRNCLQSNIGSCTTCTYEQSILTHANRVVLEASGQIPNTGQPVTGSVFRTTDFFSGNEAVYFPSGCPAEKVAALNIHMYCDSLDYDPVATPCTTKHMAQQCMLDSLHACTSEQLDQLYGDPVFINTYMDSFGKCVLY
uniref:ORF32 n=1 Tax=Malaco herpesvirus 1 TaxID=3031797 RepID=A0AA48SF26_9VIRU|nr:TPA_asm: ORF32 [Malaco herpesvirus 1]